MSKKKQFKLNKKTILIGVLIIAAIALLYFVNARNGGDSATLTSNLIGAVIGENPAEGLQEVVSDVSGSDTTYITTEEDSDDLGQLIADSIIGAVNDDDNDNNDNNDDNSDVASDTSSDEPENESSSEYISYKFRNNNLLTQHYEKHGIEMGFSSKEAYEKAASDVINNPNALHKTEKEDGDFVYYVEDTNEFVILSTDGYIRTYFLPSAGISYYNRQ